MSSIDPHIYSLSERVAQLRYADLLPINSDAQAETREFLQKIVDILIDYVELSFNPDTPVLDFHRPDCLKQVMDVDITEEGQPLGQLITDCAKTLKYQVKTGHPRFLHQLSTGLDVISMAADWLTAATNVDMSTYDVSPVFIVIEDTVSISFDL
jgi:glutamate decarboxylase